MSFIGREHELSLLRNLLNKTSASLAVIKGRRRIGKSRLIQEFAADMRFLAFSGLPPTPETTPQSQRDEFARQLERHFKLPKLRAEDWGDLFSYLAQQTKQGRVVILLDEISWMGSLDPDFLGKLKNAWDLEFNKNPNLILLFCGSVSSWIEKNILNSTGFLGRLALKMTLEELPLRDCNHIWDRNKGVSAFEKFKILAITGGIPRYLELIQPKIPAEESIRRLCFSPEGVLVDEFEQIFSDIFSKRSHIYKTIVEQLIQGPATQEEICEKLNYKPTGEFSEYLKILCLSGFISRDFTWHLNSGKPSKLSKYRLSDNYVRFYLKYIQPNHPAIQKGNFKERTITSLPGWESIMGLQFENLVLNNSKSIIKFLGIRQEDIVFDNPYFQRKTNRQEGCQIDYLIQTRFHCLYVCEIKFSRYQIEPPVIHEVEEKIRRLKFPKNFSYRPVLIHVNGVREDVIDHRFFSDIIDFSQLLTSP